MTPQLQTEQDHQKRAFELYYTQGSKRSHEKVARELGVSVASIKARSRSFSWSKRVSEKDAEQTRKLTDRVLSDQSEINNRNLKIVRAALLQTAKDISQGKVKPQMGDLERLMRFEEYLTSQRTQTGELPDLDDPIALRDRALRLLKSVLDTLPGAREKILEMLNADGDSRGTEDGNR